MSIEDELRADPGITREEARQRNNYHNERKAQKLEETVRDKDLLADYIVHIALWLQQSGAGDIVSGPLNGDFGAADMLLKAQEVLLAAGEAKRNLLFTPGAVKP